MGGLEQEIAISFMGIDAGISGALAVYTPLNGDKYILQIADMPSRASKFGAAKGRKEVDENVLNGLIRSVNTTIHICLLETPHSMPRDGHVGAFSFGRSLGVVQGVLAANGVKVMPTMPAVWKSRLGLSTDKQKSLDLASKLFPTSAHLFKRKKDDGRAEAALLAYLAADLYKESKNKK